MNRIKAREQAFFLIFQSLFKANVEPIEEAIALYSENIEPVSDYAKELYNGTSEKQDEIDEIISSLSNGWKINRLPKVSLSILRLAIYEMTYVDSVLDSIAINEAVELSKKYSSKEDSAFVNGILGAYSRGRQ